MEEYISIIIAVITGLFTVLGSYLANSNSVAKLEVKVEDLKEDIKQLSDRVNKHNNLVERMAVVESKLEDLKKN